MLFGEGIDNSKLTPEYNNGQGEGNATEQNQNNAGVPEVQPTPNDGQVGGDEGNQQVPTGIQVGEETFESQEDFISAYNNMKKELETRNASYKELQGAYTKSRQELALRNKIATPMNTGFQQPVRQPIGNPMNPYASSIQQQQFGNNAIQGVNPMFNFNQYAAQQQQQIDDASKQTMITMAIESKILELKTTDPEFDEVATELWNIMDDPNEMFANMRFTDPDMAKNMIHTAYTMAKQRVNAAKANIKINNAKNEAYQSKQQKLQNNDNSNVANKGKGQPEKTDEQKIKDSILQAKPIRF